jgi:L-lactate dehydrogenase complex protein LldG
MGAPAKGAALMDRQSFLARVRTALREVEDLDLPGSFPRTPASGDGAADVERFMASLAASNGVARVVRPDELAGAVADVAAGLPDARRAVVTADVDPWWPQVERGLHLAGADVTRPSPDEWRDLAAGADLGVTSAALAVAATGSLLLIPGRDAPRVASLLPSVHLAVLPADRVVPGLEEALAVVADGINASSAPVLVTGPSRTSDIEMTTVYGVHGPRSLHVFLVI